MVTMKKKLLTIKSKISMFVKRTTWLLVFGPYFKYILYRKYDIINLRPFKFSDWHTGCNYFLAYSENAEKKIFIKTSGRFKLANREIDLLETLNKSSEIEGQYFPNLIAYNKEGMLAFLATEWIEGIGLDRYIDKQNERDTKLDSKIIKDMSHILNNLHNLSIIHRDVRPANFILDSSSDSLKLIDFAFALGYDNPKLGEVQLIKDHPRVANVLGDKYKPSKLVWDDAHSIHKIANEINPQYNEISPKEYKNISSKIGKKTYSHTKT